MSKILTSQWFPISKRMIDVLGSALLLIILSPVYLMLALLVLIYLGWPIIFSQTRPGWRSIPFKIFKFRSMRLSDSTDVGVKDDSKRLTPLGRALRASSLDELPEFWNVLIGDMSLVGPRPLLMSYLERYSSDQLRRQDTKPGITGWAQINGRNTLSWEDKFKLDVWYIDNWSFWLDIKILILTVWKVIRREGISQEGEATAKEWMGN